MSMYHISISRICLVCYCSGMPLFCGDICHCSAGIAPSLSSSESVIVMADVASADGYVVKAEPAASFVAFGPERRRQVSLLSVPKVKGMAVTNCRREEVASMHLAGSE